MARMKTAASRVQERHRLAARLREVRVELLGESGGPELARRLGLPTRSWYNYEIGVTVPAEILLRFLDVTGTEPRWLLTGEGERFRAAPSHATPDVVMGAPAEPETVESPAPAPVTEGAITAGAISAELMNLLLGGEFRVRWAPDRRGAEEG